MNNRRAFHRYDLRLSAEISLRKTGGPLQAFLASTRDLSVGGCCLETAYPLPEAEETGLQLFLVVDGVEDIETPPLSVTARVQWSANNENATPGARYLSGLQFVDASEEQKAWLEQLIARSAS